MSALVIDLSVVTVITSLDASPWMKGWRWSVLSAITEWDHFISFSRDIVLQFFPLLLEFVHYLVWHILTKSKCSKMSILAEREIFFAQSHKAFITKSHSIESLLMNGMGAGKLSRLHFACTWAWCTNTARQRRLNNSGNNTNHNIQRVATEILPQLTHFNLKTWVGLSPSRVTASASPEGPGEGDFSPSTV